MSKQTILLIFFFAAILFPQSQNVNWYKGNLHTHSLWSDGDAFPEMAVDWYKKHGYHFIALSDHNILANVEKWIKLKEEDEVYHKYKKDFAGSSIEEKREGEDIFVKLKTLNEYRPLFQEEGKFLIIESEEISDKFMNKPVHINANNIRELIEPQGGNSILEVMQNNINAVNKQRESTGIPMFPHVNHPNFGWAVTAEDIIGLEGEKFFEVYNGHPWVNNYGDNLHPSIEEMWDVILTERLRAGKDLMYGLAVDDAHNYLSDGIKNANPGRGWVMVKSSSLTEDSLISALEKGDFYSSSGVELSALAINNERIKISAVPENGAEYIFRFIGSYKDDKEEGIGIIFQENKGTGAEYIFKGTELYVRTVVISSKLKENPYKEGDYETAWIQPVVVE